MLSQKTNPEMQDNTRIEPAFRADPSILKYENVAATSPTPASNGVVQDSQPVPPPPLPHGYSDLPSPSANAQSAIHGHHSEAHIHPDLRSAQQPRFMTTANMMPAAAPQQSPVGPPPGVMGAGPSNQPPAPTAVMMASPEAGEQTGDGRKAKRELSQSKRAAQNRAAQRAFRQRKEGYIKKLEQQVRDFTEAEGTIKNLQAENYLLREYVIQLQSRLLGAQHDCPPPPPSLNLDSPQHHVPGAVAPPAAQPGVPGALHGGTGLEVVGAGVVPPPNHAVVPSAGPSAAGSQLEEVAQAVANLGRADSMSTAAVAMAQQYANSAKQQQQATAAVDEDDARTAEEISRQLHADGLPTSSL